MGHGIHTYFKPSIPFNNIKEVFDFCKCHLNQYNPVLMENSIWLDPWCFMLDFPDNRYEDPSFPYLKLYTQGHLSILYDTLQCRNDIKTICEMLGAKDWWTCDECSDDIVCDLSIDEFEKVLESQSIEYEKLLMPTFLWPQNCHFIHDGSFKRMII